MTVFNGKSVYSAIVSGNVTVLHRSPLHAERISTDDTERELERVKAARYIAAEQLQELYDQSLEQIGESNAQIFGIHMMMLEDEDYNGSIDGMIKAERVNAEYAVARTSDIFAQMLEAMDNEYMRARSADVRDVSERIISILSGSGMDLGDIPENAVICADDISPSEAAELYRKKAAAFITAHGSAISHTAILAHSMNIPTIIGIGDELLSRVKNGSPVIIDGFSGKVILDPDSAARSRYENRRRERTAPPAQAETRTADGKRIYLFSSTDGVPTDADGVFARNCRIIKDDQEQIDFYQNIAEQTEQCRVIIRMPPVSPADPDRQNEYRRQIRAVLRATSYGSPSILFPMITSVPEARKILAACDDIRNELRAEGVECSDTKLGFMIETPAAAIISDILAPMADMFIIDTDSVARHTLASQDGIFSEEFADGQRTVVLRLISYSIRNAVKNGARIGVCGGLAEDPSLTEEFLRMGVDKICVPEHRIREIREAVMNTDLS